MKAKHRFRNVGTFEKRPLPKTLGRGGQLCQCPWRTLLRILRLFFLTENDIPEAALEGRKPAKRTRTKPCNLELVVLSTSRFSTSRHYEYGEYVGWAYINISSLRPGGGVTEGDLSWDFAVLTIAPLLETHLRDNW